MGAWLQKFFPANSALPFDAIVSGGQTGADRAGLDWATEMGIPQGGWCPKDRKAEDGPIPACYALRETPKADYLQHNEWNVRDSDGTAIFTLAAELTGGSKRNADFVEKRRKPWLHITQADGLEASAQKLKEFVERNSIRVLNVAGTRGSKEPEVGTFVRSVLDAAFSEATA